MGSEFCNQLPTKFFKSREHDKTLLVEHAQAFFQFENLLTDRRAHFHAIPARSDPPSAQVIYARSEGREESRFPLTLPGRAMKLRPWIMTAATTSCSATRRWWLIS